MSSIALDHKKDNKPSSIAFNDKRGNLLRELNKDNVDKRIESPPCSHLQITNIKGLSNVRETNRISPLTGI